MFPAASCHSQSFGLISCFKQTINICLVFHISRMYLFLKQMSTLYIKRENNIEINTSLRKFFVVVVTLKIMYLMSSQIAVFFKV